jgi:hypothetical protein
MVIRLLYFDGCPNTEETLRVLQGVLQELGVIAAVEMVRVTEESIAEERFLGSPSIQIDGMDIERSRRADPPLYGCRVYRIGGRLQSIPSKEMIREAIGEMLRPPEKV